MRNAACDDPYTYQPQIDVDSAQRLQADGKPVPAATVAVDNAEPPEPEEEPPAAVDGVEEAPEVPTSSSNEFHEPGTGAPFGDGRDIE